MDEEQSDDSSIVRRATEEETQCQVKAPKGGEVDVLRIAILGKHTNTNHTNLFKSLEWFSN